MKYNIIFVKIIKAFRYFFLKRSTWKELPSCDVLLLRHDNDCGINFDGKKYSALIDSLCYLFTRNGYRCSTVVLPFSENIDNNYSKVYAIDKEYVIHSLLGKFYFTRLFGLHNRYIINIWSKIIKRTKAKIVIGIQPDIFVCSAGSLSSVPVYDLQHGCIESSVRFYNNYKCQPYGFLTWDQNSLNILVDNGLNTSTSLVLGHPFIYRFHVKNIDDIFVAKYVECNVTENDLENILITTQPNLDTYYNAGFKVLPQELIDLIYETKDSYNYFIRVHPVLKEIYIDKIYTIFKGISSSLQIDKATNIPLPALLSSIDLHITYHSAVVKECSQFGINSILLSPEIKKGGKLESLFAYEISQGIAKVVEINKNKILSEIEGFLINNKANEKIVNSEKVLLNLLK